MVPLDSVRSSTPPHILPMGAGSNYNGFIRDCQAVPGLARVNGRPPFQMWQGLPLQHYTMVYSMRSNQQRPRDRAGHGQATVEQTYPRSAAEPEASKVPYHVPLVQGGGGTVGMLVVPEGDDHQPKTECTPHPTCNPPTLAIPIPPGGEPSLGPKSIENTRRQRRQRNSLQGAEADLHCETMVQFCGAIPPPPAKGVYASPVSVAHGPEGGNRHFMTVPPPLGGAPA